MTATILLGYEVGSGNPVAIPIRHLAITGQTQQSGKTTTLDALIARSPMTALAFITKRGETCFSGQHRIMPYFRDRADWQFVTSLIDAALGEKNKFIRPWIMKICRTTRTLRDVQEKVREALKTAKGLNESIYTEIDAYLDLIVPEVARAKLADRLDLIKHGINVMDVTGFSMPMQALFIRSALEWVNEHCRDTIVVMPEAWEFVAEGRSGPAKLAAIALVRKGSGLGNHIWIDSQDMAGVDKTILRGCTVWLIGAQREANEIKRNLSNIPAGIGRPKASEIALLERGQFFACFGHTVKKVYVKPVWMAEMDARAVAMGVVSLFEEEKEENTVTEAEAQALRDENAGLKKELETLRRLISPPPNTQLSSTPLVIKPSRPLDRPPGRLTEKDLTIPTSIDVDALYAEFKRRALAE